MASRFYLCAWEGDGTSESPFRPRVADFWDTWRAVDGREDPAQAGGEAFVEAFDITGQAHGEMIASGDVEEVTMGTVQSQWAMLYGVQVSGLAQAAHFFKTRVGDDNPPFKPVNIPPQPD